MSQKLSIINYGLGNLGSIQNMYKKIGIKAEIAESEKQIAEADKLILPGVGSFDEGMCGLKKAGLTEILEEKVIRQRTPILGVCLGMQLLTKASEEGREKGLGWIQATAKKFSFPAQCELKIPHMGWNEVEICRGDPLVKDLTNGNEKARFYFVHSYFVECEDDMDILLKTIHGKEFGAAFRHQQIMGVQFHPEKSHRYGMQILKNFYELQLLS